MGAEQQWDYSFDVVVVGSVASGAEVIAHGNVHVYGQ